MRKYIVSLFIALVVPIFSAVFLIILGFRNYDFTANFLGTFLVVSGLAVVVARYAYLEIERNGHLYTPISLLLKMRGDSGCSPPYEN